MHLDALRILFQHSNIWQNSAKVIIVPISSIVTNEQIYNTFSLFNVIGLINSVLIFGPYNLKIYTSDLFSNVFKVENDQNSFDLIFKDKLKNWNGFELKILVGSHVPRFKWKNGAIQNVDLEVLRIAETKLNLRLKHIGLALNSDWATDLEKMLITGKAVLSLVTVVSFGTLSNWRQIYPYDEKGYCALVPIPPRLSFLHFLLTPFDVFTWLYFIVITTVCALLWKIIGKASTTKAWNFVFAVAANFVGQSVSVGNKRRLQVILLQLCILMTFIMGNAYQSLIVATMTFSREGLRYQSFEELFNSDLNFTTDRILQQAFISAQQFDLAARMETVDAYELDDLIEKNSAIIGKCDLIHYVFEEQTEIDLGRKFYLLPDQIMKDYEKLLMTPGSAFFDILQNHFNTIFESGIRQHLTTQFKGEKLAELRRQQDFIAHEVYLLTFDDIYGAFYILIAGWLLGGLSFCFENGIMKNFRKSCQTFFRHIFSKLRACCKIALEK